MATVHVYVPEAYALDAEGNQLEKLVIKHASTRQDMEPQLSAFIEKWSDVPCSACGDDHNIGFLGLCPSCLNEFEMLAQEGVR